jgi:DDE superfamily endonuclease/Psq-like protein
MYSLTKEQRCDLAAEACRSGAMLSLRQAALQFNVNRATLTNRLQGKRSAKEYHQTNLRLTVQEEESMKRCLYTLTAWGWPATIFYLKSLATSMLVAKGDLQPLGQNWYKAFLRRHPDLQASIALSAWFDLYKKAFSDYEVLKEDEYNMDETGFMKGIGDDSKVIVPVEEMEAFSVQPGNPEWVSVIECIGTDGFYIPGFVIFKGKQIQENWIPDTVDRETVINVSENGWTDSGIALDWIKHFDKHTKMQTWRFRELRSCSTKLRSRPRKLHYVVLLLVTTLFQVPPPPFSSTARIYYNFLIV